MIALAATSLAVAVVFLVMRHPRQTASDAVNHGMLQVEMGRGEERLDPAKPLRCFVDGRLVGQATLTECAAKNGVAAQNLDVGLDQNGQIAAQAGAAEPLTPLPQPDAVASGGPASPGGASSALVRQAPAVTLDPAAPPRAGGGECLRYAGGSWRAGGDGSSLKACVHALYDARCVHAGEALYGRFGGQTLRLVPGRVEISADNRRFRPLVAQDAQACTLAE